MNLNMVSSDLSFVGNRIKKISVENTIINLSGNAVKQFGFEVIGMNFETEETGRFGQVIIEVNVSVQSEEGTTDIDIISEGCFSSPMDTDEEKFKKMVACNGAAALYSLCRAKVELISASIYHTGKLTLPFINIYDYYEEKNRVAEKNAS